MTTLESRLNETVKLLLTRTGQSHADLAGGLGLTRAPVSARLRAPESQSVWRVNDLPPLADFFGLTVCELISGYSAIPEDRLPPAAGSAGQTRI